LLHTLTKFIFWNKWNQLLSPQPTSKVSFFCIRARNLIEYTFFCLFVCALKNFRISEIPKKKYFKNLENLKNTDFDARIIFFFQKTKICMKICQKQEDWGYCIIGNNFCSTNFKNFWIFFCPHVLKVRKNDNFSRFYSPLAQKKSQKVK
jgi:hypothetical protein